MHPKTVVCYVWKDFKEFDWCHIYNCHTNAQLREGIAKYFVM